MIEERRGGLMRRAYTALAFWYAMACCLPAVLTAMMDGADTGGPPGRSYVDGRSVDCSGRFGCPSEPADLGAVLRSTALILVPSLLLAVPLCAYLARKWQMPALAGLVSAVIGWACLCVVVLGVRLR